MPQLSPEPQPVPSPTPRPSSADLRGDTDIESARNIEALGRVASVVGHELTNVLQILSSSLDRLADPASTGSAMIRTARASLERGVRLARQLQAFARANPPRVQRLEAHQLIATWLPTLEEAVGPERHVELRLRHGATILVDPTQLQTAIVNLLTNARDATSPGSVIVVELSRSERSSGPSCRISVMDRGEGMTEEVAHQAVEPFFTTRPAGHGIGLGLTIARMVAEAHGGYLELDSRVGLGTTVSLVLPIATAEVPMTPAATPTMTARQPAPTPTPPPQAAPAAQPESSGRVLVVDDEEAIAEYFRIILAAERYDVSVVASMRRAIDEFTRDPAHYDVVLLDMMLGDGSGMEVYRRVRQLHPETAIVVCTGFADNESLEQIRAEGHDVLLKPCSRVDVVKAVGRAMVRRKTRNG